MTPPNMGSDRAYLVREADLWRIRMKDVTEPKVMKDATELKGLNDLKTAATIHLRSIPHQEGTEYLELYLASNEKKRLAKLTQTWERQQRRTQARRAEVIQSIAKLEAKVGVQNKTGPDPLAEPVAEERQSAPPPDYSRRRWKKMTLDY